MEIFFLIVAVIGFGIFGLFRWSKEKGRRIRSAVESRGIKVDRFFFLDFGFLAIAASQHKLVVGKSENKFEIYDMDDIVEHRRENDRIEIVTTNIEYPTYSVRLGPKEIKACFDALTAARGIQARRA